MPYTGSQRVWSRDLVCGVVSCCAAGRPTAARSVVGCGTPCLVSASTICRAASRPGTPAPRSSRGVARARGTDGWLHLCVKVCVVLRLAPPVAASHVPAPKPPVPVTIKAMNMRKWTPTSMSDADASVSISDADALLDTRPLTYADISQRRASLVISRATSISVVVSALSVYVILLPLLLFTCSLK